MGTQKAKQKAKQKAGVNKQTALDAGLYVTATPIGNLRDISLRALDVLAAADIVLCEDMRITRKLFTHYGLANKTPHKTPNKTRDAQKNKQGRKLRAYHEHNAARLRPQILTRLNEGAAIALVSDAGTPLISDPGYRLVQQARAAGHPVFAIPGACAPIAALSCAGLPSDRFFFLGFLPAKKTQRQKSLKQCATIQATFILFESPRRLCALLQDIEACLGAREIVVCRELTKKFDHVKQGTAANLHAFYRAHPPKGEIIVLVAPPDNINAPLTEEEVLALLAKALPHQSMREAAAEIALSANWSKRAVYQFAIKHKATLEKNK